MRKKSCSQGLSCKHRKANLSLAASETGEDYAVKEYKKALDETLPAPVRDLVETQYQSVKLAHDKVKGMRDRLNK